MESNFQQIEFEIKEDIVDIYPANANIKNAVSLFLYHVAKGQFIELQDALQIRYIEQQFKKFDVARTLLLGQFELYIKYIHKLIGREPKKTLKPCLTDLFSDFLFLQEGSSEYDQFWAKNATDKTPTYSPEHFQGLFPLGKEFKLTYDLRNSITHNSKLYGGLLPSVKNLPSDLSAIIAVIVYITDLYSPILESTQLQQTKNSFKPYLELTKKDFQKWKNRFISIEGKEDFTILEGYAIEEFRENEKEEEKDEIERKGAIDYLRKNEIPEKRMMIWAEAGMGKSTTLQYLTYKDACDILEKGASIPIPIYIPLKLETEKDTTIEDTIATKISVSKSECRDLLLKGEVSLFIDGFNEILKDLKEQKRREIENLILDYPNTFIIISNRPQTYKDFVNIPIFRLQKMNKEQIILFIERNSNADFVKSEILKVLNSKPSFLNIISAPLILWMLINIIVEHNDIPTRRTVIFEEFMRRLYNREAQKDINFDVEEFDSCLRCLAIKSYYLNYSNSALYKFQIENILLNRKKEYGLSISIPYFIDKVIKLNILACDKNLISFAHQEYQTYFAGEELDINNFIKKQ